VIGLLVLGKIVDDPVGFQHIFIPEGILKLKRSTLRIHRVMAPQREVLNRISRGDFKIIREVFSS